MSASEVMDYVASRVAPHKKVFCIQSLSLHIVLTRTAIIKLRFVEFIDVIPKSPSGKILRRVLRDRAAATHAAPSV
jgi:acyl-coenzyme A synthetase/AMP-(fatty) acid ligase